MKALEISFLAGGAALSLFAGAAAARFGLSPLDDAFGRYEARAAAIALPQPPFRADPGAAGQGQLQAAVYDEPPPAVFPTEKRAPVAHAEDKTPITVEDLGDARPEDGPRGEARNVGGDVADAIVARRDGQVADIQGTHGAPGPSAAPGAADPAPLKPY